MKGHSRYIRHYLLSGVIYAIKLNKFSSEALVYLRINLVRSHFTKDCWISDVSFHNVAYFTNMRFDGALYRSNSTFANDVYIPNAFFNALSDMISARIERDTIINDSRINALIVKDINLNDGIKILLGAAGINQMPISLVA